MKSTTKLLPCLLTILLFNFHIISVSTKTSTSKLYLKKTLDTKFEDSEFEKEDKHTDEKLSQKFNLSKEEKKCSYEVDSNFDIFSFILSFLFTITYNPITDIRNMYGAVTGNLNCIGK